MQKKQLDYSMTKEFKHLQFPPLIANGLAIHTGERSRPFSVQTPIYYPDTCLCKCDSCDKFVKETILLMGEDWTLEYCQQCHSHFAKLYQLAYRFSKKNRRPERSLLSIVYSRYRYIRLRIWQILLATMPKDTPLDLFKIIIDCIYQDPKKHGLWQLSANIKPLTIKSARSHCQSPINCGARPNNSSQEVEPLDL